MVEPYDYFRTAVFESEESDSSGSSDSIDYNYRFRRSNRIIISDSDELEAQEEVTTDESVVVAASEQQSPPSQDPTSSDEEVEQRHSDWEDEETDESVVVAANEQQSPLSPISDWEEEGDFHCYSPMSPASANSLYSFCHSSSYSPINPPTKRRRLTPQPSSSTTSESGRHYPSILEGMDPKSPLCRPPSPNRPRPVAIVLPTRTPAATPRQKVEVITLE